MLLVETDANIFLGLGFGKELIPIQRKTYYIREGKEFDGGETSEISFFNAIEDDPPHIVKDKWKHAVIPSRFRFMNDKASLLSILCEIYDPANGRSAIIAKKTFLGAFDVDETLFSSQLLTIEQFLSAMKDDALDGERDMIKGEWMMNARLTIEGVCKELCAKQISTKKLDLDAFVIETFNGEKIRLIVFSKQNLGHMMCERLEQFVSAYEKEHDSTVRTIVENLNAKISREEFEDFPSLLERYVLANPD
nr:hypothetical protein [Candidatus Sigynarchaeota archaeon]